MAYDEELSSVKFRAQALRDRKDQSVLVLDAESSVRNSLRQSLYSLGFGSVTEASSHANALKKMEEQSFDYVLFDVRGSGMSPLAFLDSVLEAYSETIAIPCCSEPTVDDVFELLIRGAKGFIVKPFSSDGVDQAIEMAKRGDAIGEAVRMARSRNEALAALVLASLDRLSNTMKQARTFATASLEVESRRIAFRRAVEIGRTFAKGSVIGFRDSVVEYALRRSVEGPAQVGRLRSRAHAKKTAHAAQIQE